jgi:GDP-L-fucose synthase
MSQIIVTGGSGLVGKYLQEIFQGPKYLSSSDYDLTKEEEVKSLFINEKPDIVIHLAAKVGGIEENILKPYNFFEENVLMNTYLLKYSRLYGVKKFLGILSTCIYPGELPESMYPMKEELIHSGPPEKTNYGYAVSKRLMASHIEIHRKEGLNYSYIIPSNIYGKWETGDIHQKHFIGALLDKIDLALKNGQNKLVLLGDGTPKRQFTYALDIAKVIKMVIDRDISENFNISYPHISSIDEIAKEVLLATGNQHLEIVYDRSGPNGQMRKDASNDRFNKIFPDFVFTDLSYGVKEVWKNRYIK